MRNKPLYEVRDIENLKQMLEESAKLYKDNTAYLVKNDKKEYIKAVFKQYAQVDISEGEIQKIEDDLSEEITYNATVAVRKYKWFNYAIKTEILILGILVMVMVIA